MKIPYGSIEKEIGEEDIRNIQKKNFLNKEFDVLDKRFLDALLSYFCIYFFIKKDRKGNAIQK